MPVLNQAMIETLRIENFIYHVIRHDADEPTFNDEIGLENEQKAFFENQIKDASKGTQFIFTNPNDNTCKSDCEEILNNPQQLLVSKSRVLTQRFSEAHTRSMSDGIFIVTVVSVLSGDTRYNLLAFLKVDFTTVYQQKRSQVGGRQVVSLTRVIDSLADSPRALQKWALIDPGKEFSWDVIALQRNKGSRDKDTNEAISEYFRAFLQVIVRENSSTLTRRTFEKTKEWAEGVAGNLPDGVKHPDLKARSAAYFDNNEKFDGEEYVNFVLSSFIPPELKEDALTEAQKELKNSLTASKEKHAKSLMQVLNDNEISEQVFDCRPNSIPKSQKNIQIKTQENVYIKYIGEMKDNNIQVEREGRETVITIRTTHHEYI